MVSPVMYHTNPFIGPVLMFAIWLVQLFVAFLIYRDAKEQKMLAPVWFILGILPMFGYLVDVVYLILREIRAPRTTETPPGSL